MNTYKIVLIGQCNSGKTSIVNRYIYNTFDHSSPTTIGASYYSKTLNLNSSPIRINIWDTAGGQSRYDTLLPMYFKSTHVILIVYDITSRQSYFQVSQYLNKIHMHLTTENPKIILVGNKSDLTAQREVDYQEAEMYAKQNDLLFIECSAYHNTHINTLFDLIVNECQDMTSITNHVTLDYKQDDKKCCYL